MELVLRSPGLSHIIQEIFRGLDFKSLVSCRLVCKSANNQVKDLASKVSLEDLEQLLEGFAKARSMTDFEKRQWNRFLIHMFTNWSESINDWSESNKLMNLYLKEILSRDTQCEYKSGLDKSPILEFVLYGNKEMVEYILYNGDSGYKYYNVGETKIDKVLLQEAAISHGHIDICESLKKFSFCKKFSLSTLKEEQLNAHEEEDGQSDSDISTSGSSSLEEDQLNEHFKTTFGPHPSPSSSP